MVSAGQLASGRCPRAGKCGARAGRGQHSGSSRPFNARSEAGPRAQNRATREVLFILVAVQIKGELQESNDVALVGRVARYFVEDATQKALLEDDNWDFAVLKTIATELVRHA